MGWWDGGCNLDRQQDQVPICSCPALWLPGALQRPSGGLGESVLAGAIFVGQGATGPLALFSVSGNTIEVLQRLRERLQSALLREQGAAAGSWDVFLSLEPGEDVEGQGKTKVTDSCSHLGLFAREWSYEMDKRTGWDWGGSLRWAWRPLGAGDLASSQSPVESPTGDGIRKHRQNTVRTTRGGIAESHVYLS